MERGNITYKTSGFLNDVSYTANLLQLLTEYKEKFGLAVSLEVYLDEIHYSMLQFDREAPIKFLDAGNKVIIKYSDSKRYDNNGNVIGVKTPFEVFNGLRFILDKAIDEYAEKFPHKLNQIE